MQKEILQECILRIQREEVKPLVVGGSTYPLHIQIQKPITSKWVGNDDQIANNKSLTSKDLSWFLR